MEFGQNMRRRWREMRARAAEAHARASDAASEHLSRSEFLREWRISTAAGIGIAIVLVVVLIYPLAAWIDSTIDDNPNFGAPTKILAPGKSHAVANAASLVIREVDKHGWTASAPWFWPTALLDDMPNYQTGIVESVSRFADTMTGIGRANDPDLAQAAQLFHYPPDVWVWTPSFSIWPAATSGSQYKQAAKALRSYNARLAAHQAAFDASAANLAKLLGSLADGLETSSSTIQTHLETRSGWPFDFESDDVFYRAKGRAYGDYIVLKGAQADFANAIAAHNLQKPWAAMMLNLRDAIAMRPWMVMNGAPDAAFFACTLCGEGFAIARAEMQMREIKAQLQR